MCVCVFAVAVVRFCTTTHQTHENSSSAESSQVEGRAVVGRRVCDLISAHGLHDLGLLEGPGPVLVDQVEALARHREELGAELGVRLGRRALPPLALRGQLGEPLREAALDRLLPCAPVDR